MSITFLDTKGGITLELGNAQMVTGVRIRPHVLCAGPWG